MELWYRALSCKEGEQALPLLRCSEDILPILRSQIPESRIRLILCDAKAEHLEIRLDVRARLGSPGKQAAATCNSQSST